MFERKDEEVKNEPKHATPIRVVDMAKKDREVKKVIPKVAKVTTDLLNIRKEAKPDADILKVVSKNAEFPVDGDEVNGFTPIVVDRIKAYAMTKFLEIYENPAYTANEVAGKIG